MKKTLIQSELEKVLVLHFHYPESLFKSLGFKTCHDNRGGVGTSQMTQSEVFFLLFQMPGVSFQGHIRAHHL